MSQNVWDKLAGKYENLWVQKYSLAPTRAKVKAILRKRNRFSLLDLGCGTGQAILEIGEEFPEAELYGADKSEEMLKIARTKGKAEFIAFDIDARRLSEIFPEKKFDAILCCHAFPYFDDKFGALKQICAALADDGEAIFIHASVNSIYDGIVMSVVEKTAEPAEYLSRSEFRFIASQFFTITEEFLIKEKFFMPSICGFILTKK
jgi:ubiquinone/menaquinone biosynthesis C-methylase UbiE